MLLFKKHPPGMHPQVDLKTKTNFAKAKKPHSQKSLLCVTVMSHRARRAVSRATVGGDIKCTQCQQICTYAHKCPGCQKVFHNICMLSMMSGTKSISSVKLFSPWHMWGFTMTYVTMTYPKITMTYPMTYAYVMVICHGSILSLTNPDIICH